jgi:hypothetical protein
MMTDLFPELYNPTMKTIEMWSGKRDPFCSYFSREKIYYHILLALLINVLIIISQHLDDPIFFLRG